MPFDEDGSIIWIYGEEGAPVGGGKGGQEFQVLRESIPSGQKFKDPLFPATKETLGSVDSVGVLWYRPGDIAKILWNTKPIFNGGFSQLAINQGAVGDCWFLATLANVAMIPELINRVVPKDNSSDGFEKGIFHFRFWNRGKFVDVVVDDQLPCCYDYTGKVSTLFTKPTKEDGFWACLLEKAYAKVYGNYGNMSQGFATDAMKDFTGGFINVFNNPDTDWKADIKHCLERKALMAAGSIGKGECKPDMLTPYDPKNPGQESVTKKGIVCGHAYSVLDIKDVQEISDPKKITTLIKLRNPWGGDVEWNGDFSDSSDLWDKVTPNLRSKAEDRRHDGEFWMPLESFKTYFKKLDICEWVGPYRPDDNVYIHNDMYGTLQQLVVFKVENSGPIPEPKDLAKKSGFLIRLKKPPSENCFIIVNILYEGYKSSGFDKSVPMFGFHMLWTPDKWENPEEVPSWVRVELDWNLQDGKGGSSRDVNSHISVEPGTAYIVPWINKYPGDKKNYLIRISATGTIKTVRKS